MVVGRCVTTMAAAMLVGCLSTAWGLAQEKREHPKEKPEKPPVVRDKEAPEEFVPREKPRGPDWDRPGRLEAKPPREKAPWDRPDQPARGEKERPPFPPRGDRPEAGDRPDRHPAPEGKPDRPPEERPRLPDRPERPLEGPKDAPPRGFGGPRLDWEWLQRTDPDMFQLLRRDTELEEQTQRLAAQYRQAPEAEKEHLRKELEELVGKHFDVRQERRLLEVRRLEQELKRLRETIEKRQSAREKIIENRLRELLGQEDILRF